jgi:hypothetical protein
MEEIMRKTVTALATLGIVAALAAAVPTSVQAAEYGWGHHRQWGEGWRGHDWRQNAWRGYGWRAHHWYPRYYSYYGY